MSSLLAIALLFLARLQRASATIKIDPVNKNFVDEYKRVRIFHGVNAVYKVAPWIPSSSGFDPQNSLSAVDSANLKRWGFNIVRLGVMWPGLEPGPRGQYDLTYLDSVEKIVRSLAAQDIFVILDLHQDLFHRKFCGEGVPDYVYDLCASSEPAGTQPFPLPAVNATYPLDQDGNPSLDSCLSVMFATYYLSAEVGAGFQCLYDNQHGLWDAMAGFWGTVAARFASVPNVLGYELINEPWAGDVVGQPKNLVPQFAERTYLQPLYQHLHKAIRKVDDEKIIFFEGLTIDYWPNGFSEGPGGAEYSDRQALAYHIYCPLKEKGCSSLNEKFLSLRREDAARIGSGMIMTEDGEDGGRVAAVMDGESLYNEDGSVCTDKLTVLSRTYPQAVAGSISSYSFQSETARFTLTYSITPSSSSSSDSAATTTAIFVNRELFYKQGLLVAVQVQQEGGELAQAQAQTQVQVQVQCPGKADNTVKLLHQAAAPASVQVTITKCMAVLGETCTCL
eukprot:gene30515-39769_t